MMAVSLLAESPLKVWSERGGKLLRLRLSRPKANLIDAGMIAALKECIAEQGLEVEAKSHPDSIYAGAIGAAIWGAFRYEKLAGLGQLPKES